MADLLKATEPKIDMLAMKWIMKAIVRVRSLPFLASLINMRSDARASFVPIGYKASCRIEAYSVTSHSRTYR